MAFARSLKSFVGLFVAFYVALPAAGVKVVELDSKGEVVDLQPKELVRKVGKLALEQKDVTTTESLNDASGNIEELGLLHEMETSNSRKELSETSDDEGLEMLDLLHETETRHFRKELSKTADDENLGIMTSWIRGEGPSGLPACTPSSGTTFCECKQSDIMCNLDFLTTGITPTTGFCERRLIYTPKDHKHIDSKGNIDITKVKVFCKDMKLLNQWKSKKLVADDSKGPERKPKPWHGFCGSGYYPKTVEGNKQWCYRGRRYLNEICWGDSSSSGKCAGTESSYKEYRTSCVKEKGETYGKCTPRSFPKSRPECECSWAGWNVVLACSAKNDACAGHACVMSIVDGKKYCNFGSEQNWQSWR